MNSTIKTLPKAKLIIDYKINCADDLSLLVDGYTEHAFVNSKNKPLKAPRTNFRKIKFIISSQGKII